MHELVLDTSLRDAAALVGLGHEALRKFVNGTTERPHQRSLRSMGQLYQQRRARGGVAEVRTTAQSAGHLKLLFSPGLDAALTEVRALFDDWREGRPPSERAAEVERWLARKLREEHAAEVQFAGNRKRGGRK
ncbi:hypothetical protein [Longimicrobium sp.]|uniref:hypothetical protein n=1 Tax=Longimicrobium sp. TaxID=2029185 RepID=UPI002E305E8D|nr:hypothetical protein [Longimicrobium sp.]HEX6042393.1 hypothetical protein [Longimicrobium sp.]